MIMDEFWEHHCIEKHYGVDHGNILLHKDVICCNECGFCNVYTNWNNLTK